MANEEEEVHKYPPNEEVESQTQCGRINYEIRNTLGKSVLTSVSLALHQYYIDTSDTIRMEDNAGGLCSIIST